MEGRGKESKSTQHDSALAKNILWTWLFHPVLQILHANYSSLPLFGQNSFLYTARSDYSLTLVEKKVKMETQWEWWCPAPSHEPQHVQQRVTGLHCWGKFSCTAGGGFLAQLKHGLICSSLEQSPLLTTRKGRQSHFFNLFLIFSIFCLWRVTFPLSRSGTMTVPGSYYKGRVMEKFHHLSSSCIAMQDPCSIFLLSTRNTYCYDYNMKTRILFYLRVERFTKG